MRMFSSVYVSRYAELGRGFQERAKELGP
jgi:hypothetical protein